jgi:hypothetical protein
MPYEEPDPVDPMTLHGVMFETENTDAMFEMAECFIDEYTRLGFDSERILKLFSTKGYAGPYLAYTVLGDAAIRELIEECRQKWGPRGPRSQVGTNRQGNVSLPVLEG